jgi:isoleucyl-tRNA synthetase
VLDLLKRYRDHLAELFIVSGVRLSPAPGGTFLEEGDGWAVGVEKARGKKCVRCWVWHPDTGKDERYPDVCPKCVSALEESRGTDKGKA